MTSDQVTRQVHLQKLEAFCRELDKTLSRAGLLPDKSIQAWGGSVAARCTQCDIQVSGEELFALSKSPSAELASAKIGRLRLGDCARKGCSSYYYHLTFRPYPDLNWPEILAQTETIKDEPAEQWPRELACISRGLSIFWLGPATRRLGGAFLLVLLLLIVRQWYIGGRIPFLHEPQKFQADPDSTPASVAH